MLQIPCSFCGPRDEIEFACRGEIATRPSAPAEVSDDAWTDWLYVRGNARGWIEEAWLHVHGCLQLTVVRRHTVTHDIEALPTNDHRGAERAT